MSSGSFKVVVNGPLPGQNTEEVKQKAAAMYGNNLDKVQVFFRGRPVVVKQGLDEITARKYLQAFEKAGLQVQLVATAQSAEPPATPAPPAVPKAVAAPSPRPMPTPKAAGPTMTCPKCGFEQPQAESCARCGIVVEKFNKMAGQTATTRSGPPPLTAKASTQGDDQDEAPPPGVPYGQFRMIGEEDDDRPSINFLEALPGVFAYPFTGQGVYVVGAGLIFFLIIHYIPFMGAILSLFGIGYYCAYMIKVVTSSAAAETEPPAWPGFSSMVEDIVMPVLKVMWVGLFCYLPAILYIGFISGLAGLASPVFWLLILLGSAYYPMALLAVAMSGNFLALNPLTVVPSIFKVPLDYAICLGAWLVIVIVNALFRSLLNIPVPVIGPAIQIFLTLYIMMIESRVLGLLYAANHDKLEWYD